MEAFLDLVNEVFPNVRQETVNQAKQAFSQFIKNPDNYLDLLDFSECDFLKQGDVFTDLPFYFVNSEGKMSMFKSDGILISNTCDSSRNDYLQFAPFKLFDELVSTFEVDSKKINYINDLKKNTITQYFYLHQHGFDNGAFNLTLINSLSRNRFMENYYDKKITKKTSLNGVGYYVFLIKLSVFLMRNENFIETNRHVPTTY